MTITIQKNQVNEDTAVFRIMQEGIGIGDCLVSYLDGTKEDVIEKESRNDLGSAYLGLIRLREKNKEMIQKRITFIVLFQIEEAWQRRGIGKQALPLILRELEQESDITILNAYNGGYLLPFYEWAGFNVLSPYPEEHYMWRKSKRVEK